MKFKVGQIWEDRGGMPHKIGEILPGRVYNVRNEGHSWTQEGRYIVDIQSPLDLITLVKDVEPTKECSAPREPEPEFVITGPGDYRTRDGYKARVVCVDKPGDRPIVGWVEGGYSFVCTWTRFGSMWLKEQGKCGADLIGSWIDKPEVNWDAMPAWANAVFLFGPRWVWSTGMPVEKTHMTGEGYFYPGNGVYDQIPEEYAPKWTGDWRDSLVLRPGYEVAK